MSSTGNEAMKILEEDRSAVTDAVVISGFRAPWTTAWWVQEPQPRKCYSPHRRSVSPVIGSLIVAECIGGDPVTSSPPLSAPDRARFGVGVAITLAGWSGVFVRFNDGEKRGDCAHFVRLNVSLINIIEPNYRKHRYRSQEPHEVYYTSFKFSTAVVT